MTYEFLFVCICVLSDIASSCSCCIVLRYAEQLTTPTERNLIASVLSGSIRAKATAEHLAVLAVDMALECDVPGGTSRYQNLRNVDQNLLTELSVQTMKYSADSSMRV